jgi:hypothetical protein
MTPTRSLALALALIAAGCTKPTQYPSPKPAAAYKADAPPPTMSIPAPAGDSTGFAKQFLAAVDAGTATGDLFTPEFRAVIAYPPFDADGTGWLAKYRGNLGAASVSAPVGNGEAVGFTGSARATKFVVRTVRTAGGWKVDWFHATDAVRPWQFLIPQPADSERTVAVVAFAMALTGKDDRLAEALMTPSAKARLAPPFASDKLGYNRGTLANKLATVRGSATGFAVDHASSDTVGLSLRREGDPAQKSLTLKLAKGPRAWDWLVEDITTD